MADLADIDRGTTYAISGEYLDDDGEPVDITDADIFFTVKAEKYDDDADDSDAIILKNGTITDGPNGTYLISLTAADTYVEPGKYYYSIKIDVNGDDSDVKVLASGSVRIVPNTTNRTS